MKITHSYLAGIIDGEGCLMISKLRNVKDAKRRIRFNAIMTIANTHIPLLEKLMYQFGGRIRGAKYNRFCLYFSSDCIRDLLPKIMPYLIVKKEQAKILLDYLNTVEANRFKPISDKQFKFYEECYEKLRSLKRIRYEYDWNPKKISSRICSVCNVRFNVMSDHPHKKYCSVRCKTKSCWTRSNKRIRNGIPAWANCN